MNIVLLHPPRHFIGSRYGISYQIPLGLVLIGGPLSDAGHNVALIDADAAGLDDEEIVRRLRGLGADLLMIGHNGSTAAHPTVETTCRYVKQELPELPIVYGGVFPTFAHRAVMRHTPEIDMIVRGEGEATAVDLANTLARGGDLADVDGLVWRTDGDVTTNKQRRPISNLDAFRPGWDLVDWSLYRLFGLAPAAGIQFSRGCPYTCSYCGQWRFWRTYRHRSPRDFVDNVLLLKEEYGVKAVLPADEHFAADRKVTEEVLDELIARNADTPLYINTTVKDALRDEDIMHKYQQAGVVFAAVGVESDSPEVQMRINKGNAATDSRQAVRLLRKHGILPLIHVIYGLENEDLGSLWRKYRFIIKMDPDFANLEYITPHFWTPLGRMARPEQVIQLDQRKWGYRNQVLAVPSMSPITLFLAVKLTELLVHVRPKTIARALFQRRRYVQDFRLKGLWHAFLMWSAEIVDFVRNTSFVKVGDATRDPKSLELLMGLSHHAVQADATASREPAPAREVRPASAFQAVLALWPLRECPVFGRFQH